MSQRLTDTIEVRDGIAVRGGDAPQIDSLLRISLVRVWASEDGWSTLLRHRETGKFWRLTYPQSEMQGGGPRELEEISTERAERLEQMSPELLIDLTLYETQAGGRRGPILPGYSCPCMASREKPWVGHDAFPLLGQEPMYPGQRRRLGLVFISPDGLTALRDSEKFFLWEGKIIGEAVPVRH
jgi:hypothetical protein